MLKSSPSSLSISSSKRPAPTSSTPISDFINSVKTDGKAKRKSGKTPAKSGLLQASSLNDFLRLPKASSPKKETRNRSSHNDLARLLSQGAAPATDLHNHTTHSGGSRRTKKLNRSPQNSPKPKSSQSNLLKLLSMKKVEVKPNTSTNDLDDLLEFVTKLKETNTGKILLHEYVESRTGTSASTAKQAPLQLAIPSLGDDADDDLLDDSSYWEAPFSELLVDGQQPEISDLFDGMLSTLTPPLTSSDTPVDPFH